MQVMDFIIALELSWFLESTSSTGTWDFEEPAVFRHKLWVQTEEALLSSGAVRDFLIAHPGMEAGA